VGAERGAGGRGCLGLEDGLADDVFRRDEFELALLSIELGGQHARDVGVGGLKTACKELGVGIFGDQQLRILHIRPVGRSHNGGLIRPEFVVKTDLSILKGYTSPWPCCSAAKPIFGKVASFEYIAPSYSSRRTHFQHHVAGYCERRCTQHEREQREFYHDLGFACDHFGLRIIN
jgi:hypothetical protein